MKILHTVESYLPERHGMQEVVSQLSERLVAMGHSVTVATSFNENRKTEMINGVKIVEFKVSGNLVKGIKGDGHLYQNFLKFEHFDIVTNFAAQQWATDLALLVLKEMKGKKVFVPTGFSALQNPSYKSYFKKMPEWMNEYDMNIFLSNDYQDINFAKQNHIKKLTIIPNGADENEFKNTPQIDIRKLLNISENTKLILHVGNHTGFKGHKEAIEIFKHSGIENAVLLIAGKAISNSNSAINFAKELINLTGLKNTNCSLSCEISALKNNFCSKNTAIIVKNLTRNQIINAFRQADIFLFPSLIECSPIVLFEAMAGSTAFLATEVGNSKEIIEWTGGGKLLPTIKDGKGLSHVRVNQAGEILKNVLNDTKLLTNMAKSGHSAFLGKFSWEKITERYQQLYHTLATISSI